MEALAFGGVVLGVALGVLLIFLIIVVKSFHLIGPTQVGLVTKRFVRKLPDDNPIAFHGEAGYQADLLMPGLRLQAVAGLRVQKFPWVQVPAGEIGVVIAQVGDAAADRREERRLQARVRQLLRPARVHRRAAARRACSARCCRRARSMPIHPVAFLVLTARPGLRPAGRRPSSRRAANGGSSRRSVRARRPSSCEVVGHRAAGRPST